MPILSLGILLALAACKDKASGDNANADTTTTTTTSTNSTSSSNDAMNGPATSAAIEVPVNVKTTFETKYPQASSVRWDYYSPASPAEVDWTWTGWPTIDTNDYVVNYNWEGNDYMAWYDDKGTWVGTIANISDYSTLPAPVNGTISKQYNGYTISSVKKENDKNRTAYEVKLENGDDKAVVLIDENGKIMKKKVTMGDSKMKSKMNPKDSAQ